MKIVITAITAVWLAGFLRMEAEFHSYSRRVGEKLSLSDRILQAIFCALWFITRRNVNPEVMVGVRKEKSRTPMGQCQPIQGDC